MEAAVLGIEEQDVRTATVAGSTLAYAVVGTGPTVLFCGWWCSHLSLNWHDPLFRQFVSRLAQRHTIIRYDRPGTGLSGSAGTPPHTVDDEVAVLAGVIDALAPGRFDLVGASSGAAAAIAYAADQPDRVGRLVLYGGFARGAELASPAARAALLEVIGSHWGLGSRLLADLFVPGSSGPEQDAFAAFQRRSATREQAAESLAASYAVDVTAELARVRAPTSVLHRRQDRAVPFALGADLARRIPGASLTALDGVDHFPWRGDADAVADAMLRGLGHHVPPRPHATGPDAITEREREILALVAEGLTDPQIAQRLVVSPHTVHRHIANARVKLGVRSRAAAAATLARRSGAPPAAGS